MTFLITETKGSTHNTKINKSAKKTFRLIVTWKSRVMGISIAERKEKKNGDLKAWRQ